MTQLGERIEDQLWAFVGRGAAAQRAVDEVLDDGFDVQVYPWAVRIRAWSNPVTVTAIDRDGRVQEESRLDLDIVLWRSA